MPQFGNGDQPDQDRRSEEQRGVFRQQRATGGGADRQPPHAVAGLQHLGERKQQETGSHQQRRVRRNDHGADRGHQRDVQKDRRRGGHAPAAEQDRGSLIDRPAHRQRQQDRDQPYAELGIACDQRAEPDHHRDHRRMIVIAAGKMLRPHPVIGFVEGDRRERRSNQAQRNEPQDRQTRVEGNPRLVGAHFPVIACARRTVRTWRSSRPRPSARRQALRATRSAPGRRPRTRRRHWRAVRRRRRDRTATGRAGSQIP